MNIFNFYNAQQSAEVVFNMMQFFLSSVHRFSCPACGTKAAGNNR